MRCIVIAIAMLVMFGCVPSSDNPLTEPDKDLMDGSILGTWFWQDEVESGYIHIGLDHETKLLRLLMTEFDRDGTMEASEFAGHTSAIKGRRYLNLKYVHPAEEGVSGYLLVKYDLKDRRLGIALMDNGTVEKAIKNGRLKGVVEKGKWSTTVRITEAPQRLRAFVLKNDSVLFPEMTFLPKLSLPKTPVERAVPKGEQEH
ncbi:MAG: hypothetical protein PVH87_09795 [Desulfobacteraceae bacterium]